MTSNDKSRMKVVCPECGRTLGDDTVGKVYKCRYCGEFFRVGENIQTDERTEDQAKDSQGESYLPPEEKEHEPNSIRHNNMPDERKVSLNENVASSDSDANAFTPDQKPQLLDCPACGAGGMLPDKDGKCTRCGSSIASPTTKADHTERVPSQGADTSADAESDSDISVAIAELARLYNIPDDSDLLTDLVSSLKVVRSSLLLAKQRSVPIYLYGFFGPLLTIVLLIVLETSNLIRVQLALVTLLGLGIFFGSRLARGAYYYIPLFNMFCGYLIAGAEGAGSALGASVLPWILYVVLMRPPHAQAFFASDDHPLPMLTVEKLLLSGSSISRSMLAKHHDLKATLGQLRESVDTYVSGGDKTSRRAKQLNARLRRLLK